MLPLRSLSQLIRSIHHESSINELHVPKYFIRIIISNIYTAKNFHGLFYPIFSTRLVRAQRHIFWLVECEIPQTRPNTLAGFQMAESGAVPFLTTLAERAKAEGDNWLAEKTDNSCSGRTAPRSNFCSWIKAAWQRS